MKVLHVINGLPSGGAEKLIYDYSNHFSSSKCNIEVLILSSRNDVYSDRILANGIKVYKLSDGSVYNLLLFFSLIKFFISHRYDVLHVHLFPSFYFISILKAIGVIKCNLIFHEHNTKNGRIVSRWWRLLDKIIYKQYKYIVCISEAVKEALVNAYQLDEKKLIVINNGIDIKFCSKAIPINRNVIDKSISEDDVLLIMVARFNPQKDHQTLLQVMALLPTKFKLILLGEGETLEKTKKIAMDLGIIHRVFFLGYRSNPYSYIKASDIFILSSVYEGFGLSCAEAMACGIPVIVSNVPGMTQVVGKAGLVFETGDKFKLKNEILSITEDPILKEKMVKEGGLQVEQFDIDVMIQKLLRLYKRTLA